MKRFAMALIRFYQRRISPSLPPSCRFQPTCSQYTYESIGKYGFVEGGWLGVAGNYCDAEKVLDYVNKKTKVKPKLKADSSFLKLTKDGLFSCGDDLEWERVRTFMAIGSGSMAAEVCMRMGLTAEEAVKWACNVDANSSEPIKTYRLTDAV